MVGGGGTRVPDLRVCLARTQIRRRLLLCSSGSQEEEGQERSEHDEGYNSGGFSEEPTKTERGGHGGCSKHPTTIGFMLLLRSSFTEGENGRTKGGDGGVLWCWCGWCHRRTRQGVVGEIGGPRRR
jgi:hypothetical protein